jgi:SAM-dependent methyltransferase
VATGPHGAPPAGLAALSDVQWLAALKQSIRDPVWNGVRLPGFPAPELQAQFVGLDGERALDEAFAFYRLCKRALRRYSSPLGPGDRVLDFGCGWARIARFFLKDVAAPDLFCVDPMPAAIELCRTLGAPGNIQLISDLPPIGLQTESFKLAYAFSVFSHLPEAVASAWIAELSSLLVPGGLLVVTSRGPMFIDHVAALQRLPDTQIGGHDAVVRQRIGDAERVRARYAAGEHVFVDMLAATEGLSSERYGEAFVPERHAREVWGRWLEPVRFDPRPRGLTQSAIVMRKRGQRRRRLRR